MGITSFPAMDGLRVQWPSMAAALGIESDDAETTDDTSADLQGRTAELWEGGGHAMLPILGALNASPSIYTAVRMAWSHAMMLSSRNERDRYFLTRDADHLGTNRWDHPKP
jgi:hypothetical protein